MCQKCEYFHFIAMKIFNLWCILLCNIFIKKWEYFQRDRNIHDVLAIFLNCFKKIHCINLYVNPSVSINTSDSIVLCSGIPIKS